MAVFKEKRFEVKLARYSRHEVSYITGDSWLSVRDERVR